MMTECNTHARLHNSYPRSRGGRMRRRQRDNPRRGKAAEAPSLELLLVLTGFDKFIVFAFSRKRNGIMRIISSTPCPSLVLMGRPFI